MDLNRFRVMTAAYLIHGPRILLMERSPDRDFLPGIWAPVGGHVEHHEFGDLSAACLREIEEETGLPEGAIEGLTLRYVLLRRRRDELRQQFIYFGTTKRTDVRASPEGTLHWVPAPEVLQKPMTESNRRMLAHHFTEGPQAVPLVGVLSNESASLEIQWAPLSDWQ